MITIILLSFIILGFCRMRFDYVHPYTLPTSAPILYLPNLN